LSYWARDRARDRLPLERAVQMLSADAALYLGLADRGRIEAGRRADLNVIDFLRLGLEAPRMVCDLPAGGQRLLQDARGFVATFVRGAQVIREDVLTEARPGRLVRCN
jgi:N-acyl-D-aspartate/D-glutamate deacylase